MTRKLPTDSFAMYVGMGSARSYDAITKHFRVTKRAVTKVAAREQWAKRLDVIEKKARELTDAKLADSLHERDMRRRKLLMAMMSRAATAIQQYPLKSGMEGIQAGRIALQLERLMAGEPTENKTLSIERTTRDEMQRFLTTEPESDDDWGEAEDDDDDAAAAAVG